jgi:NADP-dependent 3-hydroxy acid dehydrogenase YdfG
MSIVTVSDMPVTLITGGGSGIGAAATRRLLAAGGRVTITGRDPARLEKFAAEAPGHDRLLTVVADASEPEPVEAAVAATVERFGRLDHVVANAGLSTHDTIAEGDPARWREMVLTNVLGPALLVRAALPALTESRGRIVLMGSVAGIKHTPGNMYSVTKWAITGMAENVRLMVTGAGIGVTLIAPGPVDTPFWQEHPRHHPPSPVVLSADDIAATIAWALTQPAGVDVNTVVVRPVGQAG